eukprot:5066862-Amphidinium_carterae.1
MFGNGVYTAEDVTYCDSNGYCYKCPDGKRQVIVCRFAAGKVKEMEFRGAGEDTTRNLKAAPKGFDSVRGDVKPPHQFYALIGYRSSCVYPAYIVTFEP